MFKVVNGGKLPTRGTMYSACVDLYAREDVVIGAGETKIVPLGVKIDLDYLCNLFHKCTFAELQAVNDAINKQLLENFIGFLRSHKLDLHIRSSLSAKKGLVIANGTGQIDLDYPDEIGIILHNPLNIESIYDFINGGEPDPCSIKADDKVAQITLVPHKSYLFGIESKEERDGGFGSTGE